MHTSSTFSVLFWIYNTRAVENQADIYARITINGKRVNLSLKQKVDINSWDAKRQNVKGNSKTAREINYYLDDIKSNLVQCYRYIFFIVQSQFIKTLKFSHLYTL